MTFRSEHQWELATLAAAAAAAAVAAAAAAAAAAGVAEAEAEAQAVVVAAAVVDQQVTKDRFSQVQPKALVPTPSRGHSLPVAEGSHR